MNLVEKFNNIGRKILHLKNNLIGSRSKSINFMKPIYLFLLLFYAVNLSAQVGINTTSPHSSSLMDISSIDKGILIPRVSLNSTTDKNTILNPANSLLVFNEIASNDTVVGYYYWSTPYDRWIKFLDELDKPGVLFATFDSLKLLVYTDAFPGNKEFNFTNVKFNSIVGSSFNGDDLTLPPGDYMVESSIDIDRDYFDYVLRIDGVENGIPGTIATVKTQAEIVSRGHQAVFTITETSTIDFIPLSTQGGVSIPVEPSLSYMKITKF